jgi:hypothetical protein
MDTDILPELSFRAGVDRVDLKEKGNGVRPAAGFTVRTDAGGWTPELSYTFVAEPFASSAMHLIGISVRF